MPSEEHLKYRKMAFNSDVPESLFSADELEILKTYGSWLAALMKGVIQPETSAQSIFVEVCNGKKEPQSEYEKAWVHFIKRKQWESENTEYVGNENKVLADIGIAGRDWGDYGNFR